MNNKSKTVMTKKHLNDLSELSNLPIILFNEKEVVYANDLFKRSIEEPEFSGLDHPIEYNSYKLNTSERSEMSITNRKGKIFWFDCTVSEVVYQDNQAILAFLFDAGERKEFQSSMERLKKLHRIIVDISHYILDSTSLEDFYQIVLKKTLQASEKAHLGTILTLSDNHLHAVASSGYSIDIKSFRIPLEDSFIYIATKGSLDRTINIKDTRKYPHYVPVETEFGEKMYIKSSLSAPIRINGNFYGVINLDAVETNAFDDEDIHALEFIRNTIEIAITNRLNYEEKAHLSYFDQVTSLHNRYFFEENSDLVIKRAKRYEESFHLVMVDIDDLKLVNDAYGHLYGDQLIKKVAHVVSENTRESDLIARYGGDEFVGIMFNISTKRAIWKLTQIKNILARSPIEHNKEKIAVSISYGIATYPEDGETIDELVHVADTRMYQQKNTTKKKEG